MTRAPILAALVFAACGGSAPPGFSTGPGVTGVPETTSGSSTSPDSSSTSSVEDSGSSAGASTGFMHDVGADTDFGTGQPAGCKGKVDLLFLIARSGNMQYVQDQFLASLPGFVQTIEDRLEGFDVHTMTANPGDVWPGYYCQSSPNGCAKYYPNCGPGTENWDCDTSVQEWRPCDSELGAGSTFNAGCYSTSKRCELFGGNRYIVSGEPDLAGNLDCIAKVGTGGGAAIGDATSLSGLKPPMPGPWPARGSTTTYGGLRGSLGVSAGGRMRTRP